MFSSERLKGIDVFVCVVDSGSFKAAAERMNLTGSAISKSIARLESRIGIRLFNRTTRSLTVTDAGSAFYRTCTDVLASLEEAELSLHAENTEPRGRIRIDLPAAFGRLQALPVILRFAQDHALLMPHISFSDRFIDLVEEGVDIAVRVGGSDVWPPALGHRYLGSERHIFCASPAYLSKYGTPVNAHDLEHHQCIAYGRADGTVSPWRFSGSRPGETERRVMPARFVLGDGEGQVTAVLAGCGIAQLPTWLVNRQLEDGTLVQVLPHLATDGLAINLVWIKSRQALPKVSALLDALAAGLVLPGSKM
ncbi:LysR substrate-binding domain-containing protein [Pseudomonas sp. BJa5]|uniref:LysR family transcriptional regulator n=1 Tax=Pseudomonas sp. BJa5 TaxID=2936270 RepID=UPI00255A1953|nr:LysR family transcriptional regulator [Pseudomonas sp. BGr12]MDL2420953.1 LysR family transcriptional regulator [Pseudomonas sp. BGr12]